MQTTVKLYGDSDDLVYAMVEIPGLDGSDEYGHASDAPGYLACSDGTVVQFQYDDTGAWRVRRAVEGAATFTLVREGDGDADEHSDLAELTGNLDWMIWCGTDREAAEAIASDPAGTDRALDVIEVLEGRKGFDHWWHDIDAADKADIIVALAGALAPTEGGECDFVSDHIIGEG